MSCASAGTSSSSRRRISAGDTVSAAQASITALRPSPSIASTSVLRATSRSSTALRAWRAASSHGVRPSRSRASRFAPAASSASTMSPCPASAASCSALRRWRSRASTRALCLSSSWTPAGSSSSVPAAASNTGAPPAGSDCAPRSSRNLARRQLPTWQAIASGEWPSLFSASSSAAASRSSAATPGSELRTAWCSGVLPSLSVARGSAPLASSVITASGRPCQLSRVAASRGVMPRCGWFTSTRRVISSRNRRRSGSTAASAGRLR